MVVLGKIEGEKDGESTKAEVAWAWKLKNRKIVWGRAYDAKEDALADAGLG